MLDSYIRGIYETGEVTIKGRSLSPARSQAVRNHSPDGFSWGYGGSGPAQLALALLLEYADQGTSECLYQDFKWDVVANLPQADFELPESKVMDWLRANQGRL